MFFMFTYTFSALGFYHFGFIFWWSIKFPQQNINQSETGIGDKELPVELYDHSLIHQQIVTSNKSFRKTFFKYMLHF